MDFSVKMKVRFFFFFSSVLFVLEKVKNIIECIYIIQLFRISHHRSSHQRHFLSFNGKWPSFNWISELPLLSVVRVLIGNLNNPLLVNRMEYAVYASLAIWYRGLASPYKNFAFDSDWVVLCFNEKQNKTKPDNEPSTFPYQLWGLYFGWAKLGIHEIFKVLVGVGRGHTTCAAKRKIVSIWSMNCFDSTYKNLYSLKV